MPTEKSQENQSVSEPKVLVNPFCRCSRHKSFAPLAQRTVKQITNMEVDKETGKVTPVFEDFDVEEQIQKCRDLAGLDYMKRLLMTGQAKPEDFYDDGKSGLDVTVFPQTVHDAKAQADANAEQLGELAKALGLEPDGEGIKAKQIEQALTAAIEKKWNQMMAAKAAESKGGEN